MTDLIIIYQVEGIRYSYLAKKDRLWEEVSKLCEMWEPRAVEISYIIRVKEYSNGFNVEMFQRGSQEELLK